MCRHGNQFETLLINAYALITLNQQTIRKLVVTEVLEKNNLRILHVSKTEKV